MRNSLPLLGALALLAACPNPVVQVNPTDAATGLGPDAAGLRPDAACVPSCSHRSCGDDGCGGSCGDCPTGTNCHDDVGTCFACQAQCTNKACGGDGCGGSCGTCPTGQGCLPAGTCCPTVQQCGAVCCGLGQTCDTGACVGSCQGVTCNGTCCGANQVCLVNACHTPDACNDACAGTTPVCDAASHLCRCNAGSCGGTAGCIDGACCAIPCSSVCCGAGQSCIGESCQGSCAGVTCGGTCCSVGQTCLVGACHTPDACYDACAGTTPVCDAATAHCRCNATSCSGTNLCVAGACCARPCGTVCCGAGQVCSGGACAGTCTGLLCAGVCCAELQTCVGGLCHTKDACNDACQGATPVCDPSTHACKCTLASCGVDAMCVSGTCHSCAAAKQCAGSTCCGASQDCIGSACITCGCGSKVCGTDACGHSCGACTVGTCDQASGICKVCTAGQKRCDTAGTAIEQCQPDGAAWMPSQSCAQPGRCDPSTVTCVATTCTPGSRKCKDTLTVQICSADGSAYADQDCRTLDAYATPAATCQGNDCVDPCGTPARNNSYLGCDFWAAVTSNFQLDTAAFKAGADDGTQPDAVSDFAVVVSNPNAVAASVKVTRLKSGAEATSPSLPAAGIGNAILVPAGSQTAIKLPWQAVSQTGLAGYAFHLVSDQPVAAVQFNPLDAVTSTTPATYSYSMDASLLVPTAALGSSYVLVGQEHITLRQYDSSGTGFACTTAGDCPGPGNYCKTTKYCASAPLIPLPAFFSVVGVEDQTRVTIRFAAPTVAGVNGTPIASQPRHSLGTYTLNRFDVLQFWTDADTSSPQCFTYATPANNYFDRVCRYSSDPTGTIILASDVTVPTQAKKVAVFSGADCSFSPYTAWACDHMEEAIPPFNTWGKTLVGVKSPPYKTSSGTPVTSPAPDRWRVVAGCAKASCPAGTTVVISPAPKSVEQAGYCQAGTCVLPPLDASTGVLTAAFLEFTHDSDFTLVADQPVLLGQFLTGQEANSGATEGDPSLLVAVPAEQWRTSYELSVSPSLAHNYVSVVAPAGTTGILVDNKALTTTNFPGLVNRTTSGGYAVSLVPLAKGRHALVAGGKVGAAIYGYDSYVSYGYQAGGDLKKINALPLNLVGCTGCSPACAAPQSCNYSTCTCGCNNCNGSCTGSQVCDTATCTCIGNGADAGVPPTTECDPTTCTGCASGLVCYCSSTVCDGVSMDCLMLTLTSEMGTCGAP